MNNFQSTEVLVNETLTVTTPDENKKVEKNTFKLLQAHKTFLKTSTVFALFTGFFAWSTYYYLKEIGNDWVDFGATTCNGYGLLVILFAFFVLAFLNIYIFKPFLYPILYELVCKPALLITEKLTNGRANLTKIKRHLDKVFYVFFLIATSIFLAYDTRDNRNRLIPLSGLVVFLAVGYVSSNNKSRIKWRTVIWGLILQFVFGLLTIRWEIGRNVLDCVGDKFNTLLEYSFKAAEFPFGKDLVDTQQLFAFRSLSSIYFVCFLVNIMYYYGIMQKLIGWIGSFLQWILGTSVCESVNSAATIFLGMSEAPILLAPYLKNLTDSEIHSMMTAGFSMVAGSVMAGYISFGARAQDLITSSIMSAPAALCYSKLMYPETEEVKVQIENIDELEMKYHSVLDAASEGVSNAISMVHGIIASLIAFIAAVYLINGVLGWMGLLVGYTDPVWTLELFAGKVFIPISFLMGVPWEECESVGTLIGIKTMVNEFVAFQKMGIMLKQGLLSERTKVITTYAICGFSNPASIGIQLSVLGALIPNKKDAITKSVFSACVGGAFVCFMTACIAGVLMPDNVM